MKFKKIIQDKSGVTAVLVAILLVVLIGFTALAIDIGNFMVVRNQLQNAADAGALAGGLALYNDSGISVNEGANQVAYDMATNNVASSTEGEIAVDVNWPGGNTGDVQRGHWSFATRTFTPNDSLAPTELWDRTTAELDADPDFINAIRVRTRREATPIASFFAGIFGIDSFTQMAEGIAYLGYAGDLAEEDVDQPIVICAESITGDNGYSCNIGRMINSGQDNATSETGGWTSFNQEDDPCSGGTNANEVKGLVCGDGNPLSIALGEFMATNGGEIQSAFNKLIDCWENATGKNSFWNLTLPVTKCPGNNVGTCGNVTGAVNVNIVWITGAGEDPDYSEAPTYMEIPTWTEIGDWSYEANSTNGEERWESFVDYFNLQNVDGSPAPYQKKAIYFLPDCTEHELKGLTGGENYGILAEIPVLVNRPDD